MIHNLKHQSTPPYPKKVKNAILHFLSDIPCLTCTKSFAFRGPRILRNNCLLNFKATAAVIEVIHPTHKHTEARGTWETKNISVECFVSPV